MDNKIIQKSETVINSSSNMILDFLIKTVNVIKINIAGILKFLFDRNIIQMAIGIIIASQVTRITNLIMEVLINPIVNRITLGNIKKVEDIKFTFFDLELKIGLILYNIVNFIFIVIMIYYIWKLSQMSNFKFITDMLGETEDKLSNFKTKTNVIINVGSVPTN